MKKASIEFLVNVLVVSIILVILAIAARCQDSPFNFESKAGTTYIVPRYPIDGVPSLTFGNTGLITYTDPAPSPFKYIAVTPLLAAAPKLNYQVEKVAQSNGNCSGGQNDDFATVGWNTGPNGGVENAALFSNAMLFESIFCTDATHGQAETYWQTKAPSFASTRPIFNSVDLAGVSTTIFRFDQLQLNSTDNATQRVKMTTAGAWDWTFKADNNNTVMTTANRNAAIGGNTNFGFQMGAAGAEYWYMGAGHQVSPATGGYTAIGGVTPAAPNRLYVYTGTSTDDGIVVQGHSTTPYMMDLNNDGVSVVQVQPTAIIEAQPVYANGNRLFRVSNFTTAANTSLQNIFSAPWTLAANTNISFSCYFTYSQGTANAPFSFGISASSGSGLEIDAFGEIQTNTGSGNVTFGSVAGVNTSTPAAVVTATPASVGGVFQAQMHGFIQNTSAANNQINPMVSTSVSGDAITVKIGSYCVLGS